MWFNVWESDSGPKDSAITGIRSKSQSLPIEGRKVEPTNLFLKPGAAARGKNEVLRIIDLEERIVSKEDDQLLLDTGSNKLFLKGGPKKPRLESLFIPQWVIGAIHILNHPIEGNQFISLGEMQSYLGYMVKVMELAGGYEWVSVLKFDDDFWHIQALSHYPWLYESHHLHATSCSPDLVRMPQERICRKPKVSSLDCRVKTALILCKLIYWRWP